MCLRVDVFVRGGWRQGAVHYVISDYVSSSVWVKHWYRVRVYPCISAVITLAACTDDDAISYVVK